MRVRGQNYSELLRIGQIGNVRRESYGRGAGAEATGDSGARSGADGRDLRSDGRLQMADGRLFQVVAHEGVVCGLISLDLV